VAIYSKGDNISDCNAAISKYSQQKIKVLIIAFSKKVRPLKIPPNDKAIRIQKTVASKKISEVQANANDGYEIISNI